MEIVKELYGVFEPYAILYASSVPSPLSQLVDEVQNSVSDIPLTVKLKDKEIKLNSNQSKGIRAIGMALLFTSPYLARLLGCALKEALQRISGEPRHSFSDLGSVGSDLENIINGVCNG